MNEGAGDASNGQGAQQPPENGEGEEGEQPSDAAAPKDTGVARDTGVGPIPPS